VLRYMGQRFLLAVLVAFAVSVIAFVLLRTSGDLATMLAGEDATAETVAKIRRQYGFDRPLWVQYGDWLRQGLAGDFGRSMFYPATVARLIEERLPNTLALAGLGLLFSLAVAIPLGVLAAFRPNTWIDRLALSVAVLGQAMPSFWFALMLIVIFGLMLQVAPISGSDTWAHFILPAVALGYYSAPPIMRLTRAGMIEVLNSDYIRTAYAKGLRTGTVLFKHALRNAIIPVVALAAVQFGNMLGGSVVIETVFALQGIGQLAYESISRNDFPVVQAVLLLVAMFYIVLVLLADFLNAWLDPRIRVG
jgi:peptide/nickel transport system permease protein